MVAGQTTSHRMPYIFTKSLDNFKLLTLAPITIGASVSYKMYPEKISIR